MTTETAETSLIGVDNDSTLQESLDLIESRLFDLHTCLPAKVLAFDPSAQTCDVQILLKRAALNADYEMETFSYPVVANVPIVYPNGGGWSVTWPLTAGDTVLLVFSERSLDLWWIADPGQEVDPVDGRKFDLSDAIAIPGVRPSTDVIPNISNENLRIAKDDGSVVIEMSDKVSINGATVELGTSALEPAVKGQTMATAVTTFTTQVNVQLALLGTMLLKVITDPVDKGALPAVMTALEAAFTVLGTQVLTSLSAKVKVE